MNEIQQLLELILDPIVTLGGIGIAAASILFIASKKFHVQEDPRIDQVEEVLPAANCGGCGFPGCRPFAEATVKADNLEGLNCPVGSAETMKMVAEVLGLEVDHVEPTTAVVRCNGSLQNAPKKVNFDGAPNCLSAHLNFAGVSGCPNGCLGLGDCVSVCPFDAIYMEEKTGLPTVIEEKCTSCGKCVSACPRTIIEIRNRGPRNRRVYVACMNTEKGGPAKKNCSVACIGCNKCVKVSDSGNVTVNSFLSYIDNQLDVDKYGPELIACCPTKAIVGVKVAAIEPEKKEKAST